MIGVKTRKGMFYQANYEKKQFNIIVTNIRNSSCNIYNMSVSLEPYKIKELPWLVATFKKKFFN